MSPISTTCVTKAGISSKGWNSVQSVNRAAGLGENQDEEHTCLQRPIGESRPLRALLPIMAVVLIAFLVIGIALPVLPLQVHQGLGLSAFVALARSWLGWSPGANLWLP
jgi:hypothetical protein